MNEIIANPHSPIIPAKKIVLIKPVKLETIGGSILELASTQSDKDRPQVGEVLAVGLPDRIFDKGLGKYVDDYPIPIEPGDIVAYGRYADTRFLIKGQEYIFVRFEDILGVVEK